MCFINTNHEKRLTFYESVLVVLLKREEIFVCGAVF